MDIITKTRKMVEKGLVLDERGNWIPLIDKKNKEQVFMSRLEAGEVLYKKKWMTIQEAKATLKTNGSLNETGFSPTQLPEDHSSTDEVSLIGKYNGYQTPDETEISETNDLDIEPMQFNFNTMDHKQKKRQVKVDDFFYDHSENETVLFKVGNQPKFDDDEMVALKRAMTKAKATSVPIHENVKELLQSFEEFDVWERAAKRRQAMFFAITSGIAAIIGCSAILYLLFT